MSHSDINDSPGARGRWLEVCGRVGWAGMIVALVVAFMILYRMMGAAVGLALDDGGMSPSEAEEIRRNVAILASGVSVIGVLAFLIRRWVLFAFALVLFGGCVMFLNGHITTH
jgi:hypothetical protein